jgi:hypothetical protein
MSFIKSVALFSLAAGSALADGLNARAKAVGKVYFGTAVDNGDLSDNSYMQELDNSQDFGQLTPANSMKVSQPSSCYLFRLEIPITNI